MSVEISENKPRIKHFLLYVIASIASLGGLLSGFDTGVISGALLYINETWPLSTLAQGGSSVLLWLALLQGLPSTEFWQMFTAAKRLSSPLRQFLPWGLSFVVWRRV